MLGRTIGILESIAPEGMSESRPKRGAPVSLWPVAHVLLANTFDPVDQRASPVERFAARPKRGIRALSDALLQRARAILDPWPSWAF